MTMLGISLLSLISLILINSLLGLIGEDKRAAVPVPVRAEREEDPRRS